MAASCRQGWRYDPKARPSAYSEWFGAVQENIPRHLAPDGSFFLDLKEHAEDGEHIDPRIPLTSTLGLLTALFEGGFAPAFVEIVGGLQYTLVAGKLVTQVTPSSEMHRPDAAVPWLTTSSAHQIRVYVGGRPFHGCLTPRGLPPPHSWVSSSL